MEIAPALQAVTIATLKPTHPVRRLLDPFTHRSIQASNDQVKLYFEHDMAEFVLAPLGTAEQLKLIDDTTVEAPLNLADMDMERYSAIRGMENYSSESAQTASDQWGWKWHYRALTVQRLFAELAECWLDEWYPTDEDLSADAALLGWWRSMVEHMPALKTATVQNPEWASVDNPKKEMFTNVIRTLMVWVSLIHEDVGHSMAPLIYNPVYTPTHLPEDGVAVPIFPLMKTMTAYRNFIFLERLTLLDEMPTFVFHKKVCSGVFLWETCTFPDGAQKDDKKCYATFQASYNRLRADPSFSECDEKGFYSCLDRVETSASS